MGVTLETHSADNDLNEVSYRPELRVYWPIPSGERSQRHKTAALAAGRLRIPLRVTSTCGFLRCAAFLSKPKF